MTTALARPEDLKPVPLPWPLELLDARLKELQAETEAQRASLDAWGAEK
jgi:hypothetical protein